MDTFFILVGHYVRDLVNRLSEEYQLSEQEKKRLEEKELDKVVRTKEHVLYRLQPVLDIVGSDVYVSSSGDKLGDIENGIVTEDKEKALETLKKDVWDIGSQVYTGFHALTDGKELELLARKTKRRERLANYIQVQFLEESGDESLRTLVAKLNHLLADEYALYTRLRFYHWNVVGPFFNDLHKFFEVLYEETADFADDIAERVRALGGRTLGSLREFMEETCLDERLGETPTYECMLHCLLQDYETIVNCLRQAIVSAEEFEDRVTSNFLEDMTFKHEKTAWKIRSLLKTHAVT